MGLRPGLLRLAPRPKLFRLIRPGSRGIASDRLRTRFGRKSAPACSRGFPNLDDTRGVKVELKRLMRLTFVFVVAAVVALGASLSAIAKGPSRAVIEGPGIPSPISLPGPNEATIGPELAALVMDSGLFTELWL